MIEGRSTNEGSTCPVAGAVALSLEAPQGVNAESFFLDRVSESQFPLPQFLARGKKDSKHDPHEPLTHLIDAQAPPERWLFRTQGPAASFVSRQLDSVEGCLLKGAGLCRRWFRIFETSPKESK
jgi:hypothetical protein